MSTAKVSALVYAVGGAAKGWHFVDGLPGLYHPDIPVPSENGEAYLDAHERQAAAAAKEWDKTERKLEQDGWRRNGRLKFVKPDPPVRVVRVSEKQAQEGRDAAAQAAKAARQTLRSVRRGSPDEAALVHREAAALDDSGNGGQ